MLRAGVMAVTALCGAVGVGVVAPAQADTVTDTFELKLTIKRWCRGNTKYFENSTVTIDPKSPSTNTTLTITRDDHYPAEIQATIDSHGQNAEVEAILLTGKGVLSNVSKRKAEFALSGVNPLNPDHFLTFRGQATLDKLGNLTKVAGTFMLQETGVYAVTKKPLVPSKPVECFASGTFGTGKKTSSSVGSGGVGTLSVANAPANVGGSFVADAPSTSTWLFTMKLLSGEEVPIAGVLWDEPGSVGGTYHENVAVGVDAVTSQIRTVSLTLTEPAGVVIWGCDAAAGVPCAGVTVDRAAGTASFAGTALTYSPLFSPIPRPRVTLNGTLTFTPF